MQQAADGEHVEALVECLRSRRASDGVDDYVGPGAVGEALHRLHRVFGGRVDHVVGAELPGEGAPLGKGVYGDETPPSVRLSDLQHQAADKALPENYHRIERLNPLDFGPGDGASRKEGK